MKSSKNSSRKKALNALFYIRCQQHYTIGDSLVEVGEKAPDFKDILCWLNTDISSFGETGGSIRYIEFWDHTNFASLEAIQFTKKIWEHYSTAGCMVIGVHSPEYEFERYEDNLQDALERYGITYPVAQDNNISTWLRYGNRFIPKQFLVSEDGTILYGHIGIGNELSVEKKIRAALGLTDEKYPAPLWEQSGPKMPLIEDVTSPIHFGLRQILSTKTPVRPGHEADLNLSNDGELLEGEIKFAGKWNRYDEYVELDATNNSTLTISFYGKDVHMVVGSNTETSRCAILIDGSPLCADDAGKDISFEDQGRSSIIRISYSGMYHVASARSYASHEITIIPCTEDVQIYSVTFS